MRDYEQLLECLYYDKVKGKLFWKIKVGKMLPGKEVGTITNTGYRRFKFKGIHYYVHRVIFYMEHGYVPDIVDHINGKRIDNRFSNLQDISHGSNILKGKVRSINTSGYTGVSWSKGMKKWHAYIHTEDYTNKTLGYFSCVHEAGEVVKTERLRLYKDRGVLTDELQQ